MKVQTLDFKMSTFIYATGTTCYVVQLIYPGNQKKFRAFFSLCFLIFKIFTKFSHRYNMQLHETTKNIFCLKKNGFTYIYTYTVDLILHVHKYLHEMSLVYDVITKKMNNHAPYTTQKSGIDPPPPLVLFIPSLI